MRHITAITYNQLILFGLLTVIFLLYTDQPIQIIIILCVRASCVCVCVCLWADSDRLSSIRFHFETPTTIEQNRLVDVK